MLDKLLEAIERKDLQKPVDDFGFHLACSTLFSDLTLDNLGEALRR